MLWIQRCLFDAFVLHNVNIYELIRGLHNNEFFISI